MSKATISVEVLNDSCWENCRDFDPWESNETYTTDCTGEIIIRTRHFECRNLDKCRQLLDHISMIGPIERREP